MKLYLDKIKKDLNIITGIMFIFMIKECVAMEINRGGAIEKPDSCKSYVPIDAYDSIECKHPEVIKISR